MRYSVFLVSVTTLVFASSTSASPIVFTHSGTGSGSIGGIAFTNAPFVITAVGDTDDRQLVNPGGGGFFIDHSSASISITGMGTFTFVTGTRTFVNTSQAVVGFSRAGEHGNDLFTGPFLPVLGSWEMESSIGPLTGLGGLSQWSGFPFTPVLTSGGQLAFNSDVRPMPVMFQATVGAASVPEPISLGVLGASVVGLVGLAWRRNAAALRDAQRQVRVTPSSDLSA